MSTAEPESTSDRWCWPRPEEETQKESDVVVVEVRSTANTGDIIVAIIDGEFTVKTLGNKRGKPVLLPANDAYSIIRPNGSLEIFGVVVGLIRKYGR